MLNEVWNLCLWLMDSCSERNWEELPPRCWKSISLITLSLHNNSIELRDCIMKSLLQRTRSRITPVFLNTVLPSVAEVFSANSYGHVNLDIFALRKEANYAGNIVLQLVHVDSAAGSVVLEYLMRKVNATIKDTISLPPHASLHRFRIAL